VDAEIAALLAEVPEHLLELAAARLEEEVSAGARRGPDLEISFLAEVLASDGPPRTHHGSGCGEEATLAVKRPSVRSVELRAVGWEWC
jgi:hypothetical protein